MPKQYRRHDNHKRLYKGLLWYIKNGTPQPTYSGITMEDIRDFKRQMEELNIPQRNINILNN